MAPTVALYELAAGLSRVSDLSAANDIVMDHLGSLVPSRGYGVYVLQPNGRPSDILPGPGVPEWFLDDYEQRGRPSDPVFAAVRRCNHIAYSAHLMDWRRWRRETVYSVLDKVGFHRSLQAPICVHGRARATINLARSDHDRPYTAADLARLEQVRRLVGDVYTRVTDTADVLRRGELSALALDAMTEPVVVSSRLGEPLLANRAARAIVSGDGQTLASLCTPGIRQGVRELRRTTSHAVRCRTDLGPAGKVTISTSWLGDDSGFALSHLFRRDDAEGALPVDHAPLTMRQRELVALVGRGLTVDEIAAELVVTANTVKQHLKRVYAKLGVSNRAELVHALWQSSPRALAG